MALTRDEAFEAVDALQKHFIKAATPPEDIAYFGKDMSNTILVYARHDLPAARLEEFKVYAADIVQHPVEDSDFTIKPWVAPPPPVYFTDKLEVKPGDLGVMMVGDRLAVPAALKQFTSNPALSAIDFYGLFITFHYSIASTFNWPNPEITTDEALVKLRRTLRGHVDDAILGEDVYNPPQFPLNADGQSMPGGGPAKPRRWPG